MSPTSLADHVAQFLIRHHAWNQPRAIALSGGIDSMVLLDVMAALNALQDAGNPLFSAIHVNHRISPNADAWADFCREQCARRGVPLTVVVVDVNRDSGTGLEAAARAARYAALMQADVAFVLSAQHRDDQAETVLHQMLRGTGLNGLAGMGESRPLRAGQLLLRPLLALSRSDIEAYAGQHQVTWIEDESNADTAFTRNFIRHELLPLIGTRFPHYAESLARTARHAADSAELQEALAELDLGWNGVEASTDKLIDLPLSRQVNALYHWLRWQKVTPPSHHQLIDWAVQLFRAPPAGKAQQAGGHDFVIRRRQNKLQLVRRIGDAGPAPGC